MTLQASGAISMNDIHVEINGGGASGTSIDMAYIYNNTRPGQQSYSLSNYYSKAFYTSNMSSNCNNGNCNCACNCYPYPTDCNNCTITGGVNCVTYDASAYLQNNCNCNCSFNCSNCLTNINYNCNTPPDPPPSPE